MITMTLNGSEITTENGQKLIEVAERHGIDIPALCHHAGTGHFTSCMVCLVKDVSTGSMIPSCSVTADHGMQILTEDPEIIEARKTALELLLSEHTGDCEAPCRIACPAFMDIPAMNRLLAAGQTGKALEVVMNDIALPGVLGRICPAPCEGACKRKPIDQAVSICLLKRFAADNAKPIPRKEKVRDTGKRIAVIGSGPAGLAAAYYLQIKGVQAVIFDRHEMAGGSLRYDIPEERLSRQVLDEEIRHIQETGVVFHQNQQVDAKRFTSLRGEFDGLVVATGNYVPAMNDWGLLNNGKQMIVDKDNYLTNLDRVFAVGNANRSMQLAIRSLAQGKEVAVAVMQMLNSKEMVGEQRRFNSSFGKLLVQEYPEYLKEGSRELRQETGQDGEGGLSQSQMLTEAGRCLHCDCRKPDTCKLRDYAGSYRVNKKRFGHAVRKPLKKYLQHGVVVYEPGKCIKCGICVRLTAKHEETFGFTFIGRGFDVEIGVPFNESLSKALEKTASEVAEACPTGALTRGE